MSLINDALKRAGQKPGPAPTAAEVAAGLRPAEEARPHRFPVLTLFIALIPLIGLGVWFVVKGLQLRETPVRAETMEPPVPAPTPASVLVIPPTNAPAPAIPAPAQPSFKLQGIYWRPSKPSAVVNGKTVYVGDRVENARVKAIDQESVTLRLAGGESKVLLLP